jgi:hypothetical protein
LDIAKMAFANMPGEHPRTRIVRRRLGKFARTGNVATADVEPITGEALIGNCVHLTPLQDITGRALDWGCSIDLTEERPKITRVPTSRLTASAVSLGIYAD